MSDAARRALVVGTSLLPWSWYLVRETHALLDWVAVLMPALLVGVLSVLLLLTSALGRTGTLAAVLAWTVFGASAVVGPWSPSATAEPRTPFVLAAANVRGDNPSPGEVAEDLLAMDADLLVVTELSPLQAEVVARLDERYRYSVLSEPQEGVGVWSDLPLEDGGRPLPPGIAGARGSRVVVEGPRGPLVLYGLHLYRPSRHAYLTELTMSRHRALVQALIDELRQEELPVLVAGDLNLTDRGGSFRALREGRVDALRSSWTGPTSLRTRNQPLLLRIDHLLLPGDWCSRAAGRRELTGSDHRAVLAQVGPCGDPPAGAPGPIPPPL